MGVKVTVAREFKFPVDICLHVDNPPKKSILYHTLGALFSLSIPI